MVADYSWAEQDGWASAWQPLIDVIGQDFGAGIIHAVDPIEKSLIRQYNEPLEFDCPLFYDEEVAKAYGYPGIIAPYSGLATWTSVGVWDYGDEPVYTTAERDVAPRYRALREGGQPPGPDTNGAFATDVEYEYIRPFVLGDWLYMRGRKLLSVLPKQTGVGRGVFTVWESEVYNQDDAHIATQRLGLYLYAAGKFS
jgi:hypothetical protein